MWNSQRFDVSTLGVWTCWGVKSYSTYLTSVVVPFLHSKALFCISNNPHRGGLPPGRRFRGLFTLLDRRMAENTNFG
jgi:hypothetical protein